jgi:DNA-binding response OmpR family regulator
MNRILIIEDKPRIAAFLEKGLRVKGFTTTVSQDGCEPFHSAYGEVFDLILLDLNLPGQHGLDILKDLRTQGYDLPIIILTASDSLKNKELSFLYGANDYLTKPFKFADLLERVRALL